MRFTTGMLLSHANTLLLTMKIRLEDGRMDREWVEEWLEEWKEAVRLWVEDYKEYDRERRNQ